MKNIVHKAAVGFALSLFQSIVSRAGTFLSQLLLARLLDPADFGEIGLVLTVNALIQPLMDFGIEDVLMSRRKSFDLWMGPAYGLSLSLSVAAAAVLAVAAPIAASIYHEPGMTKLILLLAGSAILYGFSIIPDAKLRSEMRFEITSTYGLAETLGIQCLTLLLAWLGFGAASFILPIPLASALRSAVFCYFAPISLRRAFHLSRWRHLLQRGGLVFGQRSMQFIREQGDYCLLGLLSNASTVGFYYFAYRIAAQPVYMLVRSLSMVLFPALAKLADRPDVQMTAVVRTSLTLSILITPISFLLCATAEPLMQLLFEPRWLPAASYLRVLSVALAFDILPAVTWALCAARGMFRFQFVAGIISTATFICCIATGFWLDGALGVACGIAGHFILCSVFYPLYCFRPLPRRLTTVMSLCFGPAILSAVAMGIGTLLAQRWSPDHSIARIVTTTAVGASIYIGLLWLAIGNLLSEIFSQFMAASPIWARRRRQAARVGVNGQNEILE